MENKNALNCDPVTGLCEVPGEEGQVGTIEQDTITKPIRVTYYTDPICSACWAIEPQLRKLKLEYGDVVEVEYRMGGLLPDWSYNSGGISKPSDVAHHWDEVSGYYDMPIDGDVWLEDPLPSSYPPSIAFKAAQMQNEEKAHLFLRELREMVFLKKVNIAKWEHLKEAAEVVGLDTIQLKSDYNGEAKQLFEADLQNSRQAGVRGFPTLLFRDSIGNTRVIYGARPYVHFEAAVEALYNNAVKASYPTDGESLFKLFGSMTAREFSELSGTSRSESEAQLDQLIDDQHLEKTSTKNGSLWKVNPSTP
ncbi:MAG: DsbA family protein [Bacteroidia bacterium]|nr:DsbA family protein [Bacteroidia bacterium]